MNHLRLRSRLLILALITPGLLVLALVGACKAPHPRAQATQK